MANVLQGAYKEAQGPLEVEPSTILDLNDSSQFMSYPQRLCHFFKGCVLLLPLLFHMGVQEDYMDQAWKWYLSLPLTFLWLEFNCVVISNQKLSKEVMFSRKRRNRVWRTVIVTAYLSVTALLHGSILL